MVRKYVRPKLWEETIKNFRAKKLNMDKDLKILGIKRRVPLTRIIHIASTKPIYLDSDEIKKISRRKKFEI